MKIKHLSLCLCLVFSHLIGNSQTVKWSNSNYNTGKGLIASGIHKGQVYLICKNAKDEWNVHSLSPQLTVKENVSELNDISLGSKFSDNYDRKTKTSVISENGEERFTIEGVGNSFVNLTSAPEVLNDGELYIGGNSIGLSQLLYVRLGNFKGASPAGPLALNYTYDYIGEYSQASVFYSPDEKRKILVYRKVAEKKKNSENIDVYVVKEFDSKYSVIREAEFTLERTENLVFMNAFGITNSGKVFFVANIKADKDDLGKLNVGIINLDSKKVTKLVPINSKAKYYRSIALTITGDDELKINSLYTDNIKMANKIAGSISVTVDLAGGTAGINEKSFGGTFPYTWENNSKDYNGGPMMRQFDIMAINQEADGISYLMAVNSCYTTQGDNPKTYSKNEGIALMKTNYDGELVFKTKINRKLGEMTVPMLGKVFMHEYKGEYYLLYCVNNNQIEVDDETQPDNFDGKSGGHALVCTKINSKGEASTINLTGSLTENQYPLIGNFVGYEDKIYLMEGSKKEVYPNNFGSTLPINIKFGLLTL